MKRALFLMFCLLIVAAAGAVVPQLTIYDDGLSCPGGCDAHVVFHKRMNGTVNAHAPPPAEKTAVCTNGALCEICFDEAGKECLVVTYRGGGPPFGRFDFTPAFYQQQCAESDRPSGLKKACADMKATSKAWAGRANCIGSPTEPKCESVMESALDARKQDDPQYARCKELGENAFNRTVGESAQRSDSCAYEKLGTGKNSRGDTWRKLLPGACRANTFVGRDGLDCCSGDPMTDRAFGSAECAAFYLPK